MGGSSGLHLWGPGRCLSCDAGAYRGVTLVLQSAALCPLVSRRREESLSALTARFSPWSPAAFIESAAFMKSPYKVLHFAPKRGFFFLPPAILVSPPLPCSRTPSSGPCPHAHSSAPRWPQRPALQPEGASHQTAAPGWRGWAGREGGDPREPASRELEQKLDQARAGEWSLPTACRG